ncbi:unnamed protein product [Mucor circinelloides]
MYNPSNQSSIMLSPIMNKRVFDGGEHPENSSIALETSQLMIRSPPHHVNAASYHHQGHPPHPHPHPPSHHHQLHHSNKRPRYEPSWTLDNLCTHPCSPLAAIDLESIFNMSTFHLLSQDKRDELCSMLPQADQNSLLNHANNYENYQQPYQHHHHHQPPPPPLPPTNNENYNPSSNFHNNSSDFFSKSENPIFWNSLTEWQTMLGHGDFVNAGSPLQLSPSPPTTTNNSSSNKSTASYGSKSHKSSRATCKKDRFKDEAFESYWGELIDKDKAHNVAGDSKSITLKDMCRKGLIREQDVIVYKRNFSACKVVVSKSMTVIKACGLSGISIKLDKEIFEDFETPTALETKILDHHGKVTKDKRPNGNAFKSIRLIRGGKDMGRLFDIRKDGFGDQSGC